MKLSEKSLELNVGCEILNVLRNDWGFPKAYLRGLTQKEERQEGVDFFAQLSPSVRLFAFQFKAPKGKVETPPYRYTLVRYQHDPLYQLAQLAPSSVFYVFPFYVRPPKLQTNIPDLLQDTWLCEIGQMQPAAVFGSNQSRTIVCSAGSAFINPEYPLSTLRELKRIGIPAHEFTEWYSVYRDVRVGRKRHKNPWLVRGFRIAIAFPSQQG
jgi:hypothetical protein